MAVTSIYDLQKNSHDKQYSQLKQTVPNMASCVRTVIDAILICKDLIRPGRGCRAVFFSIHKRKKERD